MIPKLEDLFQVERVYRLLFTKLQEWVERSILMLPNLAVAVILLLLFALAAFAFRALAIRLTRRFSRNETLNLLFSDLLQFGILCVGIFVSLGVLNLDKTVTSLLAGAGIVGLALSFAFQDLATNFASGIFMNFDWPFRPGDMIETNGYTGYVEKIHLRATLIRTFQGQTILLPNKDVFQRSIVNFTTLGRRRIDLPVSAAYWDDPVAVKDAIVGAVSALPGLVRDEPIEFFFEKFGESSIDGVVRFWIPSPDPGDYMRMRSDAIVAIKRAMDARGLTIPFPIRTIEFRGAGEGVALLGKPQGGAALPGHGLVGGHAPNAERGGAHR